MAPEGYMPLPVTAEWETPAAVFSCLNKVFEFQLDVCATAQNTKAPKFFSPEEDGMKQRWSGRCWMNPPYGRGLDKWVEKAFIESSAGRAFVAALLPVRTDTRWWQNYCRDASVYFIPGRVYFEYEGKKLDRAPFPSAIVLFWPKPGRS